MQPVVEGDEHAMAGLQNLTSSAVAYYHSHVGTQEKWQSRREGWICLSDFLKLLKRKGIVPKVPLCVCVALSLYPVGKS